MFGESGGERKVARRDHAGFLFQSQLFDFVIIGFGQAGCADYHSQPMFEGDHACGLLTESGLVKSTSTSVGLCRASSRLARDKDTCRRAARQLRQYPARLGGGQSRRSAQTPAWLTTVL